MISALALTVTSPFLVVIAIAVRWDSPGPIFFRQDRVGEDGRIFQILKFRTMYVRRERGPDVSGTNDPRITRVG
ncbi:MAG: sugar transferase, partial [Actinomycetota bacterium]|nr:sugar transferase [Actinomycetota bacterium]